MPDGRTVNSRYAGVSSTSNDAHAVRVLRSVSQRNCNHKNTRNTHVRKPTTSFDP